MFHATNENLQRVRFDALEDWLAKRLQANTPWDTIAAGMITASGRNDENGAVAFSLAHEARPVEMAGEVSRIFMGVQIQCAQCHDHKTDSWKRRQFHELAAFFSGVQPKQVVKGGMGELPVFAVITRGSRRYTMPELDNPAKQVPIAPRFFLASSKSSPAPALPEGLGSNPSGGRWPPRTSPGRTTPGSPRPSSIESGMRSWVRRFTSRSTTSGRSGRPGRRGARAACGAMAEGGIRHPMAVPDDPQHRSVSAAGCARRSTRQARRRLLRAAPAGSAPTRFLTPLSMRWRSPWMATAIRSWLETTPPGAARRRRRGPEGPGAARQSGSQERK